MAYSISDYELLCRKVHFEDIDHDNKVDKDEISLLNGSKNEKEVLAAMAEELGIDNFEAIEGDDARVFNKYILEMGHLFYDGMRFATSGEALDKKRFNLSLKDAKRYAVKLGLGSNIPDAAFKERMTAVYQERLERVFNDDRIKENINILYNIGSLLGKTKADVDKDLANISKKV